MDEQTPIIPQKNASRKKLILLIVILIIILVGGFIAYGKFIMKANSISEMMNPTKFNPTCKYNDPNLCKFINNWPNVKNFTMESASTSLDGKVLDLNFTMDGDDKSQMISRENGKESANYINIGDMQYTKDYTDNKWFKYAYSNSSYDVSLKDYKEDFSNDAEDTTLYQKIGTEVCDKYTCFKYQVIYPRLSGVKEYIFFDTKQYLLRKTWTEANDGSTTESTYDYSNIKISEPSPIKEGIPYSTNN